jgi:hypothetical protein
LEEGKPNEIGGMAMAAEIEMWVFSVESGIGADPTQGVDVTGFGVEASDGSIGKVDEATYEEGAHGLVVDTGPWIFGKKVVLPAGVIERVDPEEEKVYVSRSKDEIRTRRSSGTRNWTPKLAARSATTTGAAHPSRGR